MRKKNICVIGKWDETNSATMKTASEVGALITKFGGIVVTGGGGGVMEAVSRGAKEAIPNSITTIGFLATRDIDGESNKYIDIAIPTGLGFDMRSSLAIRMCDAVIMIGGGNGTLGEASIAYLERKRIIVVKNTGGWADRIESILYEGKYLDERKNVEIVFASSPQEAVATAMENPECLNAKVG